MLEESAIPSNLLPHNCHPGYSLAIGAMAIWFVAVKVPDSFNRQTSEELARVQERNFVSNATFPEPRSLAIEVPRQVSISHCPDLCLLLLYTHQVARVLLPPSAGDVSPKGKARTPTIAYRLEEADLCPNDNKVVPHLGRELIFKSDFAKQIREAALTRMAAGECLVREELPNASADLSLRIIDEHRPGRKRLLPGPLSVLSTGLELRSGETLIARELTQTSGQLLTPLHLVPLGGGGGNLGFNGWDYGQKKLARSSIDSLIFLKAHTPFDFQVPKGASPVDLRQQLDRFLAGTATGAEDAASSLLGIYMEELTQHGPERGDFARLKNLIQDSRLTSFPGLGNLARRQSALAPTLFEAMLNRLPQAASLKGGGFYRELDRLAESLPAELFRRPDPRWDALLADPAVRAESTYLVLRLVERGSTSAPQLLAILSATPTSPEAWSKDRNAAIRAFCALGPSASQHLPALRSYATSGIIPASTLRWGTWKAMLVALGAPLNELPETERKSISDLVKNRCGYPQQPRSRGAA